MNTPDKGFKEVLWDLETSYIQTEQFSLYPEAIPYTNIIKDWRILCASWKVRGSKKIYSVDITQGKGEYHVVKTLWNMLQDVDLLIGHNGKKFDFKMFYTRLMYYGLPPLPEIRQVDTLREVKRIGRFTSNKLDYLGEYFNIGRKIETDRGLWHLASAGDKKAIKKMVRYNRQDVQMLSDFYDLNEKYFKTPFKSAIGCPFCGSNHIQQRGSYVTLNSRYRRYQCQVCAKWFKGKKDFKTQYSFI